MRTLSFGRPALLTTGLAALAAMLTMTVVVTAGAAQRQASPPSLLPPLVYTCPMHPDVVETKAGTCALCKMNLVPARLGAAWMCPLHAAVVEDASGTCRLCGRTLAPVTVSLSWTCRGEINAEHLEPGRCADGSPRIGKRGLRPHGNHNPQHGGQFFMAPDSWHHIEGAYPRAGLFRLHVYDDYTRAVTGAALGPVVGRVVTEERFDAVTRTTTEVHAYPLRLSKDGTSLDALPRHSGWPARVVAKVRFKPGEPEHRFDFTFVRQTVDPAPRAAASQSRATPRSAPTRPPAGIADPAAVPDAPSASALPTTIPEILEALRLSRADIGGLVQKGDFPAVWVPAFRARDLALALEPQLGHLEIAARGSAEPSLFRLVQAAWRLDAVGDTGNRPDVEAALAQFDAALADVLTTFGQR